MEIYCFDRGVGSKVAVAQKRVYPRCASRHSHVASHLGEGGKSNLLKFKPQNICHIVLKPPIPWIPMQTSMEADCEWSWWIMMTMLGRHLSCQDQFLSRCPLFAFWTGWILLFAPPPSQNSGMPNFHLLTPTSLDITPERKETDRGHFKCFKY